MKLFHIPNIVLGIKLRNRPIVFIVTNLSFRYWTETENGSLVINNEPIFDYINNLINGAILIEKKDVNYSQFDRLATNNSLNCMSYSYADMEESTESVDSIDQVLTKLEQIIELNLTELLKPQNISISNINLEY